MGNIVLLDDLTINKIAAGEVIERPASVIKEMVENSIDAGAKNITVEIKNGGISLIRIIDDGKGIAEDDLEIAFERHATSKIRKAEDLAEVMTMGFRGEALASIAAIANVEMISRTADSDIGHKIVVEGGRILEKSEAGSPVGTKITVQNLFYNTPVRYKFLKKDYTEAGYIEDAIKKIALYNKDVSFKLISNGKTILQTNGNGDLKTVIYSIFGKEIASELIDVDYTFDDMRVTGVIGKPVIARANRQNQLFFVNGRCIKDKNLSAAAEQAYKGVIPVGRYGFMVLNLEINPQQVDVNVHPAKLEVRFEDESAIFKVIYHAIKNGLMDSELVANTEKPVDNKLNPNADIQEIKESEENMKENKRGFASLFKRKEDNKDDEFTRNNTLEEIFKFRQSLKEIGVNPNPTVTIEDTIRNRTNVEGDGKEIKFGNTIIKSDTRELNTNEVNEALDDKRKEILAALFGEKKEEKETVDEEKVEIESTSEVLEENVSETVLNDTTENNVEQDENVQTETKIESKPFDIHYEPIKFDQEKIASMINKAKEHLQSFGENVIENLTNNETISNAFNNAAKETFDKTQVINTDEVNSKASDNMQKTQIIDSVKDVNEELSQDTIVITAEERNEVLNKSEDVDKTVVLDENINDVLRNNIDVDENGETKIVSDDTTEVNINEENVIDVDDGENAAITETLLKAKMDLDNTQIINTDEVRKKMSVEYETNPEFEEMYKKTFGVDTMNVRREKERIEAEKEKINVTNELDYANMNVFEDKEGYEPVNYKFVGIAFNTYIIIEIKDEMYMIDQHAAHERILYEIVKANYYSDGDKDEQMLLMPDIINLTHKELEIAKENRDMFSRAGFSFDEFGDNTIKLVSVPGMCEDLNTKQLFLDLLDEIDTVAVTARQEKEDKFIATVACKAAVKAKMKLDVREVDALMRELLSLPNPFSCPHGRPTAIKMTKIDMEKKFNRR